MQLAAGYLLGKAGEELWERFGPEKKHGRERAMILVKGLSIAGNTRLSTKVREAKAVSKTMD